MGCGHDHYLDAACDVAARANRLVRDAGANIERARSDLKAASHPSPPRLTGSKPHDEERVKVLWGALQKAQKRRCCVDELESVSASISHMQRLVDGPHPRKSSGLNWVGFDHWLGVARKALTTIRSECDPSHHYKPEMPMHDLAAIDRLDPILIAEREAKRDEDVAACRANRLAELKERLSDTQSEIERLEGEVADGD